MIPIPSVQRMKEWHISACYKEQKVITQYNIDPTYCDHQSHIAVSLRYLNENQVFTARIRRLWEGNVFIRVCTFTGGWKGPLFKLVHLGSSISLGTPFEPLQIFKLGTPPPTCWQAGGWSSTEKPPCVLFFSISVVICFLFIGFRFWTLANCTATIVNMSGATNKNTRLVRS